MQLIHKHSCQSPAASTPFTTGRRCKPNFEFDAVCQRLELDSQPITTLVKNYFQDLQLCFTTANFTTTWQHLEVGIMAGCTVSSLIFTMAMEVMRALRFCIGENPIPTMSQQPVKSLGRWYNASLKDKHQVEQLRQEIAKSLDNIDKTLLPGKLKFRTWAEVDIIRCGAASYSSPEAQRYLGKGPTGKSRLWRDCKRTILEKCYNIRAEDAGGGGVVRRGSNLCPLPNPSNPQTHHDRMQDEPHAGEIHLAAQPGPQELGISPGEHARLGALVPFGEDCLIIELTVQWENSVEEAYERKKLRYSELAEEAMQRCWNTKSQLKWDPTTCLPSLPVSSLADTNLLDCSCNGLVALALDSSVHIWNSETRYLLGRLDPLTEPGRDRRQTVSCLCWSQYGRVLSIGTRRGEVQVQLWDVEQRQKVSTLLSHLSVVRALSWKQQLLSSGSALGNIHHHDPRAPAPPVGSVVQQGGVCSLQWSPGDEWLASGSPDGLLHVWDDIMGLAGSHQTVATMQQPSAVKMTASIKTAMGWCPWQRKMIATGGGWKDGKLRIWDTESATCVTSVDSNSQICCLCWTEATRCLFTGHGRPLHSAICWEWDLSSLRTRCHLAGHSNRILHVASNPDARQLFTVGADQCFYVWDI
ncbi:cell division cycle protein 20 homolog [Nerophis ophidion]|uniref:cell division cycle protein 20 homolog n=1 Tax=Nerophis ophidion TaxID=159077 RepID=UPI002AE00D22|nr:cell division cycle protein 20 homolog [Nerophis ophidion]